MTIHPRMSMPTRIGMLAAFSILASTALFCEPAHAVGDRQCYVTEYYSDTRHTQLVGQSSTCPDGTWGRRTQYSTTQKVSVGNHSPGAPGQGPSVPCEFRADPRCQYLPTARTNPNNGMNNGSFSGSTAPINQMSATPPTYAGNASISATHAGHSGRH